MFLHVTHYKNYSLINGICNMFSKCETILRKSESKRVKGTVIYSGEKNISRNENRNFENFGIFSI